MLIPAHFDRVLLWVAAAHVAVAVASLFALSMDVPPVLGAQPALKPLKFGVSIAIFLATMAVLLPAVSLEAETRRAVAWTLSLTMVAEMVPIGLQAIRGTSSHFNLEGAFNTAMWRIMLVAILIVTFTMVGVTLAASFRPLRSVDGAPMDSLLATAWRAGLWLFLLAAISGFAMGGRLSHSVGGDDRGDLRVPHFFALHALQVVPMAAAVLAWLPIANAARWAVLIAAIVVQALLALATLVQALAAKPAW